jgi:hypothetical protein
MQPRTNLEADQLSQWTKLTRANGDLRSGGSSKPNWSSKHKILGYRKAFDWCFYLFLDFSRIPEQWDSFHSWLIVSRNYIRYTKTSKMMDFRKMLFRFFVLVTSSKNSWSEGFKSLRLFFIRNMIAQDCELGFLKFTGLEKIKNKNSATARHSSGIR